MKKKFVKAAALALSLTLSAGSVLSVNAAETQPVTVEQQTLGLSSIDNARQLGGYVTKDGRHVKDNLLLRTAKLSTASEEDLQTLKDTYNLGYVVDFRTSSEIASLSPINIPMQSAASSSPKIFVILFFMFF